MKAFIFLAIPFLVTAAASAQPVKDVADAEEAVRAHIRDMQPALLQIREMTNVLQAFARVQRDLSDATQPGIAIDKARGELDDYVSESHRRGALLDRETRGTIEYARRELDAAHNASALVNVNDLREKIHHNVIHPLQRRTLQMTQRANAIITMYMGLANTFRAADEGIDASLAALAMDPEKP